MSSASCGEATRRAGSEVRVRMMVEGSDEDWRSFLMRLLASRMTSVLAPKDCAAAR